MIGLLIQDNAYEQDIRELLMSFYPGETYAHEIKDEVDFYVQTRFAGESAEIALWERAVEGQAADGNPHLPVPVGLEGWRMSAFSRAFCDLSDHSETKNVIKQAFYSILTQRTGHELPWGSLTGIRPTKIALSRLEEGW